jgi:hypothetical protein
MRAKRLVDLFFAAVLAVPAAGTFAAQQTNKPPAAPIPTPIFTGKKVFISSAAGGTVLPSSAPELTYDEFYAAMKSWGRFEPVSAPSDADLIFEISLDYAPYARIRLLILDPKTHVVLWPILENVRPWTRVTSGRKNFDQVMANVVDTLKKLAVPPPILPANPVN